MSASKVKNVMVPVIPAKQVNNNTVEPQFNKLTDEGKDDCPLNHNATHSTEGSKNIPFTCFSNWEPSIPEE